MCFPLRMCDQRLQSLSEIPPLKLTTYNSHQLGCVLLYNMYYRFFSYTTLKYYASKKFFVLNDKLTQFHGNFVRRPSIFWYSYRSSIVSANMISLRKYVYFNNYYNTIVHASQYNYLVYNVKKFKKLQLNIFLLVILYLSYSRMHYYSHRRAHERGRVAKGPYWQDEFFSKYNVRILRILGS